MNLDELKTLAAKVSLDAATLNRELAAWVPPAPTGSKTILQVARGVTANAGVGTDLDKLKAMFPTAAKQWGKDQGMWADPSSMLQVFPDGRFRAVMDRGNWAKIPNAAIPLDRKVSAARISYQVEFGPTGLPWQWGVSGKLPGLARHAAGRFPGGGNIGATNFSACLAWSNKDKKGGQVGLGPYVYGQHKPPVTDQWWGPNYPDGTLRWGSPTISGLDRGRHLIEIEHTPLPAGKGTIQFKVDGATRWAQTMQLVAPDQPHEITHCHFRVMYGGDTLDYWPPISTVVEFSDFKVEEL